MSGAQAPRRLRAIERPEEVARHLEAWAAAFQGVKLPARQMPRVARSSKGKPGHLAWDARISGIDIDISIEVVSETRWRLDHNRQGALAEQDGKPLLLRQWYVKRAPNDASLTAAEIAQITEEPPCYVTPGIARGTPLERRLYQVVADLSAPAEQIREQTAASIALHRAAMEKFGFA
jgi:hypothetical protein